MMDSKQYSSLIRTLDALTDEYEQRFHRVAPWGLDSVESKVADLKAALQSGVPLPENIADALY